MKSLLLPFLLLLTAAQSAAADLDPVLVQRAARIVENLGIADAARAERVTAIIARQYADLRPVHDVRDAALAAAKQAGDKAAEQQARDTATARQSELHYAFLGKLAAELSLAQIEQVKDGMTYGVMPNTFRVYEEMLPDLTPAQKAQVYAWLVEAREHAMDAGSSDEKHRWFGKYKGRINNLLAAAGIDLKQAERDMFARRKAQQSTGSKN